MKPIILLFSIFLFNLTSFHDPCNDSDEIPTCKLEMSKEELKKGIVGIDCNGILQENIKSFKIKFPKKPTQLIRSSQLSEKAIAILEVAEIGHIIAVFDIMDEDGHLKKTMFIKIVE